MEARRALSGDLTSDAGITDAISHLIAVGTSAGGARAKAVIALDPISGEVRSGQVPTEPGFEPWLLKFDGIGDAPGLGDSLPYGRIEFAYSLMAVAAGITMTECKLLEEGGRAHFMTRRFDRAPDGTKIHSQTLCALGSLDFRQIGVHDYSQLFLVVDRLHLGPDTRAEVFRRMTFNVAAAICDDHTKNFSFLLPRGGAWELSPAYDVTHSHDPGNQWMRQHLMAVNGRTTDITRSDVLEVADRFEVPGASEIVRDVCDAVDRWHDFAATAKVPDRPATRIDDDVTLSTGRLREA